MCIRRMGVPPGRHVDSGMEISRLGTRKVCSSKNCKSSGSRLEICQVDLKIVSRREVDLRFVKST